MADVSQWRRTLLTLPDTSFFQLVRNYLGEIQTPFNKQSLLDRLQAFLRRPATQEALRATVDADDTRFLAAVELLENPRREELVSFLGAEYTRLEIQNRLLNLQDRLLVFPDPDTERLHINPLLESALTEKVVRPDVLFPRTALETEPDAEPWLTDTLLSASFSLLMEQPLFFRANGGLKKRSEKRLDEVAPSLLSGDARRLELLLATLTALGLADSSDGTVTAVPAVWQELARLSVPGRTALVWATAAGLTDRGGAATAGDPAGACILRTLLPALEPGYALRDTHLLQLLGVAAARCGHAGLSDRSAGEDVLDRLCELGVLVQTRDASFAPVRAARQLLLTAPTEADTAEGAAAPAVVTPSYQLTLTPAASLAESLPAVAAARLERYDRYCEYELSRETVLRAFRAGFRAADITGALETLHRGALPQNVRFSISTWRDEYERVELLDGIVLLIDEAHAPMLEHSPQLAPYLRRRLGPGAFLLARDEEAEWREALEQAGLGAVPAVKTVSVAETPELRPPRFAEPQVAALPSAGGGTAGEGARAAGTPAADDTTPPPHPAEALREAAAQADLGEEQRREVERRIERKLIIVPEQITAAVAPREMPEARGLDYVGKVKLIEQAVERGTDYLEIIERGNSGPSRLFIRPRRLDRGGSTLTLRGETVGDGREVSVRVDKIGLVRVVQGTLFVR